MKCLICGRLSLPGAKLCLDCKAARKRAFDATVTQPLLAAAGAASATRGRGAAPQLLKPGQSVPDAARRAAKMALAAQAQSNLAGVLTEPVPRRPTRWPIIVGGLCLFIAITGYFGHWFGGNRSDTFAAVPERSNVESDAPPAIVRASTPNPIPAPAPTVAVEPVAAAAEQAPSKADTAKRSVRPRPEKPPLVVPIAEPPPPEVVAVAPPPPVVREAPRVDPFQAMYDAIARCPRDISGRASCEQRVRAQYCEGHWGQVSQCASIPYVDHGQ
jgi:hypothetical protein